MPTVLENYHAVRKKMAIQLNEKTFPPEQAWEYQELLYRIEVLEACQMFDMIAPVDCDAKAMLLHYQMVDAYIQGLCAERRYGTVADEHRKKQRETARDNLLRVIQDYRKRFSSFNPDRPEQYKKEIWRTICSLLPAWLQYRNTYVALGENKEAA